MAEVASPVDNEVVLQETPVAPVEEAPPSRAIEEIWPGINDRIFKPPTELRFAEDLDISLPGRSGKSRGKKRKGKGAGSRAFAGKGAKSRGPRP